MNKNLSNVPSAGTNDQQYTAADDSRSANVEANPMLADAVQEGNKLIADFMGVKIGVDKYSWRIGCIKPLQEYHLNYHKEWGWLMPVVEKIEKDISKDPYYGFTVRIADRCCLIACHERNKQDGVIYQTPWGFRPLLKIDAVWLAVIEFIKWYNANNNKSA